MGSGAHKSNETKGGWSEVNRLPARPACGLRSMLTCIFIQSNLDPFDTTIVKTCFIRYQRRFSFCRGSRKKLSQKLTFYTNYCKPKNSKLFYLRIRIYSYLYFILLNAKNKNQTSILQYNNVSTYFYPTS